VTRCWDGKNLDSPDHQSHVAYGQGSGANGGGACPSTHPTKLPQVMYELMWDVNKFADKSLWPTDGSDPFVYSMNIGGSAAHGDYVFGWEGDSLQKAMDNNCNLNTACPKAGLTVQEPAKYNACKKKQQAPEDVDGCKCLSDLVCWSMLLTCGDRAVVDASGRRYAQGIDFLAIRFTPSSLPFCLFLSASLRCEWWRIISVLISCCPALVYLSCICNSHAKIELPSYMQFVVHH
jgi:hypothetical protein